MESLVIPLCLAFGGGHYGLCFGYFDAWIDRMNRSTIKQHLLDRKMDISLHPVWISEHTRAATFPLWNLSGQMVGYQRYMPDKDKIKRNNPTEGRYFTRVGVKDTVGVWGLESWRLSNTLFVTEGIFDACRITYNGHSAVALLSYAISRSCRRWLETVRCSRKVVGICDSDDSGVKLSRYVDDYYQLSNGDLGDADEDTVRYIVKKYQR